MHYTVTMPASAIHWSVPSRLGPEADAHQDRRWPTIVRKLRTLRKRGRRSVRIVDANCGGGALLMLAAGCARELGFVAIEARGIDRNTQLIAQARRTSARILDPAIGLTFEVGDADQALREEAEFPADLLLYAKQGQQGPWELVRSAARTLVVDRAIANQSTQ